MLDVSALHTYYGRAHILADVSFSLGRGEVVALLGRNGAGKSTTLKSIMGLVRPARGRIGLDGHDITGWPPQRIARLGLGYVPEERRVFAGLTVLENLEVGRRAPKDTGAPWTPARLFRLFPNLAALGDRPAGQISGGEQQMLAIARALVGNPTVLLMDEPFEGLAPIVVEQLAAVIAGLRADDAMTMVLVEQRTDVALELAERAVVMERGKVVFDDASARLRADSDLLHTLVGVG